MESLEQIPAWQKAVELAREVYHICRNNPWIKDTYGIRQEIQTTVLHIASNIAKRHDRDIGADCGEFLYKAKENCSELKTQFHVFEKYFNPKELEDILMQTTDILQMLDELIKTCEIKK